MEKLQVLETFLTIKVIKMIAKIFNISIKLNPNPNQIDFRGNVEIY